MALNGVRGSSLGNLIRPAAARLAAAGLVFAAFSLAPAAAAAREAGGQVGSFLFYGVGGRALAMGGAYYGISDDANAMYWNPAGLTLVQRKEVSFMQATLPTEAKMTFFSYAHPTKGGSVYAVGMTQMSVGGFEKIDVIYDGNNEPTSVTKSGSFDAREQAMGFSWGKNITETLAFGLTLKQVSRALAGKSDTNQTLDVGMMKGMGPFYRVGFGIQNVFALRKGETDDRLPVVVRLGNSFRFFKDRLTIALDATKPMTGDVDVRFGGEYWVARWFAFRFGLMGIPDIQETDFGFGLKFRSVSIDIAQGIHDLGASASTRMSMSFRFGQSKEDRASVQVKEFVKQGQENFNEGNFTAAVQKLNSALDAQPGNKQVEAMLARLMAATSFVPSATGGEEIQSHIRKGVISYVDGRDLRNSVNALRHAFNKNVKDEKVLGLLNMVEKEAGVPEITKRVDGPEQFTWVDQKIFDARQSVYDGKYDMAVKRSQDVLDLEPSNITALEVMGSAFYMMEQKEKALAVWRRVLELDPNNQAVKEFIQKIK
ncbi:MAG: PorV/PorQ family protein [Elusimicrobia bacterium]|nr:PorV/PorQ family protein [Elusimicrobiota bacterium]